jgi:hypothetical protein
VLVVVVVVVVMTRELKGIELVGSSYCWASSVD